MDFSKHGSLQTLNWVLGETATAPASLFIQLHIGDPGENGVDNPAANTTRQAVSFAAPTNIGTDGRAQAVTDAEVTWLSIPADETYTHVSLWGADAGDVCWYKGVLVAPVPVLAGGNFVLPVGSTIDHS